VGGVETVTGSLACGLAKWGETHPDQQFDVTVVTNSLADNTDDSRFGFRVVRRPSARWLVQHIRTTDVLHVAGPALFPMLVAQLFRTPTVVEHHGYQSACPNGLLLYQPDQSVCPGHFMAGHYPKCVQCNAANLGWIGSCRNLLLSFPRRWLCRIVAGNISVTRHVASRILLPRTRTIYHGVQDLGEHQRKSITFGPCELRIGYVGRLVGGKGLSLLLRAAKQLESDGVAFSLTIIGDGPLRTELEASSRRLGLQDRVSFAGELRGPGLSKALERIQVVAMPSEWEETAGLVAMEQMMRGGLIVAADIGGLGEVVGNAGLIFPAGDSRALAACLEEINRTPSLVETLGCAARSRAKHLFGLDDMIQKHVDFYREVTRR
jgi:glycosyltransferase involved in cell wall biosynthesis